MITATHGILQSGQEVAPPSAPYEIYTTWNIGIPGATWTVTFSNNDGVTKGPFSVSFGSGESIHREMTYFDDTMHIDVHKTNNGGVAQDAGTIYLYKAGSPDVLLDSFPFVVSDNVSHIQFDPTGLSAGDIIFCSVNEG